MRRDNINRLQDSRISIDSEADTNGKIYILLSFFKSVSKIFGTRLGLMIPGFSNHGLSGLLAINNEKETSKNIFSYNDKPTPPLKKAQKSLYKKEA